MEATVADLKRWWVVASVAALGFAVYVSLVPFEFGPAHGAVSGRDIVEAARGVSLRSRGNFLANILLFVPVGFFVMAALIGETRRPLAGLAAGTLVVSLAFGFSWAIESLQQFVPTRTPAAQDVVAQSIGAIVGVIGWVVCGRYASTYTAALIGGARSAFAVGLLAYVAFQGLRLLEPLDVTVDAGILARKWRSGGIVLSPAASPLLTTTAIPDVLADLLFAVPVGTAAALLGVRVGHRRTMGHAILLGGAFFAVGELAQVFVQSRTADVVDFLVNLAGVCVGIWFAHRYGAKEQESQLEGVVWTACLLAGAVFYAAYQLSPYDFTWSPSMLAARAGAFLRPPFSNYYQATEMAALSEASVKIGLGVPLGVFAALHFRGGRRQSARPRVRAVLITLFCFFVAVEAGQCLLPSRYPDLTDVLLACGGSWLWMALANRFLPVAQASTRDT